jgi:hypothetical protein
MHIKRIKVVGFKALRSSDMELNEHLNIIVGDNEAGKSAVLEAANLVLSCQANGRNVAHDLDPYHFNCDMVKEYFAGVRDGMHPDPPRILIEAYLDDAGADELAKLKGTNNTRHEDCPGLYLAAELNCVEGTSVASLDLPIRPHDHTEGLGRLSWLLRLEFRHV